MVDWTDATFVAETELQYADVEPIVSPAASANVTVSPYGVIVGGPASDARVREHRFYGTTKIGGALIALIYICIYPTGWIEWSAFGLFYVLHILSESLGYHRYFTHRSFETSRPMRYALGILAQCGAYGSLLYWCADHRRHHSATDKPGDPHSPYFDGHGRSLSKWKGIAHAHYAWIFDDTITDLSIFGKGTNDDPAILFAHRTRHFWFAFSTVLLPAFWGWAFGGTAAILSTVMVAGFLRMMVGMHAIVLVNSIGHVNGYQRFKSPHSAKNNWFIALITLGEGWHSNHHTYPNAASTSMAWYEIDITGLLISLLEKIGLVWNVRRLPPAHIRKTQISQTS